MRATMLFFHLLGTAAWLGGGLAEIFAVMAVALFVFGTVNALAVRFGAWRTAGERILGRRGG